MYLVKFTKRAEKDKKLLKAAKLEKQTKKLLDILVINPECGRIMNKNLKEEKFL